MATSYTSLPSISVDLQLYVGLVTGAGQSLAKFPALARQRFAWIVDNWVTLYPVFKSSANGNQDLEAALEDFRSSVEGYKLTSSGTPLNVLDNQSKLELYNPFLELIDTKSIGMNAAETSLVNNEVQRVSKLSSADFRSMLAFLNDYMTVYSSSIGLYDADGFYAVNGVVQKKSQTATISDLDKINDIIEIRKYVESILVSLKSTNNKPPNLLAIANANITAGSTPRISTAYSSSVAVPFEISLEHMAEKFMDSKSLWYELVTVNNLQPPYVDEIGKKYKLIAPGALSSVTISDERKNDINVGAKVGMGSVKQREESRFINKIIYNSDGTMVLFLSGEPNLNNLKTTENAYIRIYAPHTVGSGSFVKIPVSVVSPTSTGVTPESDDLRRLDKALLAFGIDISQSDIGDISVAPNGNFNLAAGMKNIKQACLNALQTVQGELPFHVNYGLSSSLGSMMYGLPDANAIGQLAISTLLKDRRITSARVTNMTFTGSSVSMLLIITVQGSSNLIPLSFVS